MTSEADTSRIRIDVRLGNDPTAELAHLHASLLGTPPVVPSRYFYDARGSVLFERICELPEYYQTRTERALLEANADVVVQRSDAEELVELGSGAATKTRVLLDAMDRHHTLRLYVPFDVSETIVRRVADELVAEYPALRIHGMVASFMEDLGEIPAGYRRLVAFLGGTLGNLRPDGEAVDFLRRLAAVMDCGDYLLLGTDLIKDTEVLDRAYNDSAGVTAEFNLNALAVLNRSFGADFPLDAFRHHAFYDEEREWVEMRLVATRDVEVRVPAVDVEIEIAAGDWLRTEISTKYDRPKVTALLAECGFELAEWYSDPREWFALSLARRA